MNAQQAAAAALALVAPSDGPALGALPVQLASDTHGNTHTADCQLETARQRVTHTVTFDDLATVARQWCRACPTRSLWNKVDRHLVKVMAALEALDAATDPLAGDDVSAHALFNTREIIDSLNRHIDIVTDGGARIPVVAALADRVADACRTRVGELDATLRTDAAKDTILAFVRDALSDGADGYGLDDDPVLVGFMYEDTDGDGDHVAAILRTHFAVPGTNRVLLVPRYVADHLILRQRSDLAGPPAAVRDADTDTITAAVALWSPDEPGAFASLRTCLDVAAGITA